MRLLSFCIFIAGFAVTSLLKAQSLGGEYTNVCTDQSYTYTVSLGPRCTTIESIGCTGCNVIEKASDNSSITLTWQSGNVSRYVGASVMCTEPDNPQGPASPSSVGGNVSVKEIKEIYFCSLDAVSYFTTTEEAPETSVNSCTTTGRVTLISSSDYSGGGATPFADFDNDVNVGLQGYPGHQQYDGGKANLSFKWKEGWTGSVTIKVEWVTKHENNVTGNCRDADVGTLGIYTFVRSDAFPGGTIDAPTSVALSSGATTPIRLNYQEASGYHIPVMKVRYFLGSDLLYESPGMLCNFSYTYNASNPGDYTFNTQVLTPCGIWTPVNAKTVKVYPTCYQDNPANVSSTVTGPGAQYFNEGIEINHDQLYTVSVGGITDFNTNYLIDFSDAGNDASISGASFSIAKKLGKYSINFVNVPGRESCPVIPPITIFLGGRDLTLPEQPCPVNLPDDFGKFGFPEITLGNIVLQHFAGIVISKRAITVKPGMTLSLGAELILNSPPAQPEPTDGDITINFIQSSAYNDYGEVWNEKRSYFDKQGRMIQSQWKNLSAGVMLANNILYDAYGRSAITTLAAPVSTIKVSQDQCTGTNVISENIRFEYKPGFVKATDGNNYESHHFDIKANQVIEDSPAAVDASTPGTLGWYYSTNNGNASGDQARFNEPLVAATSYPYLRTLFHRDGSGGVKGETKPGDQFKAGSGHLATTTKDPVSKTDEQLISYLNIYSQVFTRPETDKLEGQFFRTIGVDENGKKTITYHDKGGNVIISLLFDKKDNLLTRSYSIYDNAGRLVVGVSPNGVSNFINGTSYALIDKTTYSYNQKGWLVSMTEPDAGTTNYVYRRDGKIRFSQSAQQMEDGTFSYTNYDYAGRPIESGECVGAFSFDNTVVESRLVDGGFAGSRTDQIFTLYDAADPEIPVSRTQRFLNGAVSRTSNSNTTSWYSYDEQGRIEWMVQKINELGDNGIKTLDYRYGPTGAVQEILYQKGFTNEQFSHFFECDLDGRLVKAYTTTELLNYDKKGTLTNRNVLTLQASYYYYLHGPLKRVEYAQASQGIDYTYTAEGALKSINDAVLANDPGKDGHNNSLFHPDVFGMTLDYYSGDYMSSVYSPTVAASNAADQFSGLIKSNQWHSPIQGNVPAGYSYTYDSRNQLLDAKWLNSIAGVSDPYLESIGSYDNNGNIVSLNRNDKLGSAIADFEYNYVPNTNRLDNITSNDSPWRLYRYNKVGQMISQEDQVTGEKLKVLYDVTGKVTTVKNKNDDLVTTFAYDDRGFRVVKTDYDANENPTLKTYYVRNATGELISTYEDNPGDAETIKPIEMPVYGTGRIGLYKPQLNMTFYELVDHLGNIRAVIGDHVTVEYSATMETERTNKETDFIGITAKPTAQYINHTPVTVTVDGETDAIADPNEVIRINNARDIPRNPIGGGILLPVHPGDKVDAEVFVKYANFVNTNTTAVTGMASYLATTFGNPVSVIDGANVFRGIDNSPVGVFAALADVDDNLPRAFLSYVIYDRNMVPTRFDQEQVSTTAQINTSSPVGQPHDRLSFDDITIDQEGFIYLYVSNQSDQDMDVYFDDLKVTHEYSDIVAGGDYYPFGLEINDRRITRESHRFGYQGLFAEKDEQTGWNHFELREYDPVIARMLSMDPIGQYWSPYVAMGNNPVNLIDPNGGQTDPKLGDINSKGQVFTSSGWLDPLETVTVMPSFFDFMDDIDAMFSGKLGFYIVGKGSDNYGSGNTFGKDIVTVDMDTYNKLFGLHKEWKQFGASRSNPETRNVDNPTELDLLEDIKELSSKYYDAVEANIARHSGQIKARMTKSRDSLDALNLYPGPIHYKQGLMYDTVSGTIFYKPLNNKTGRGDWSQRSISLTKKFKKEL